MSLELYRTFDIHELLPDLDESLVDREVGKMFKDLIDSAFKDGTIWPGGEPPEYKDSTGFTRLTETALGVRTWSRKISAVIKTPRSLKFFQRSVARHWGRLRGEVGLAELMAIEAIRVCATASFEEVMRCVGEIAEAQAAMGRDSTQVAIKAYHDEVLTRLSEIKVAHLSELECESIRALARDLASGQFSGESPLQSLSDKKYGQRYFQRFSSIALPSDAGVADQTILKDMKAFMEGGDASVVAKKLVENEEYRNLFEHFGSWLKSDWARATLLFSQIVDMEFGKVDYGQQRDHAWFPIWRMMSWDSSFSEEEPPPKNYSGLREYRRSIESIKDPEQKLEWVTSLIYRAIRRSIAEMNDLFYYLSGDDAKNGVLGSSYSVLLREAICSYLKATMKSPEDWISILAPGYPYQLYHLFYQVASQNQPRIKHQPQDWTWAIPGLLAASDQNPQLVQSMLIMLVSIDDEMARRSRPGKTFSIDVLRGLCGNNEDLMRKYSTNISRPLELASTLQPRDVYICKQVQHGAHLYLSQGYVSDQPLLP